MKYNEDEYKKAEIALQGELEAYDKAIKICEKYIKHFDSKSEHEIDVKKIKIGLDVLQRSYDAVSERGVKGVLDVYKKYPDRNRRPGLGLSRGFGELFWEGKPWEKEIFEAVDAIEDYFGDM